MTSYNMYTVASDTVVDTYQERCSNDDRHMPPAANGSVANSDQEDRTNGIDCYTPTVASRATADSDHEDWSNSDGYTPTTASGAVADSDHKDQSNCADSYTPTVASGAADDPDQEYWRDGNEWRAGYLWDSDDHRDTDDSDEMWYTFDQWRADEMYSWMPHLESDDQQSLDDHWSSDDRWGADADTLAEIARNIEFAKLELERRLPKNCVDDNWSDTDDAPVNTAILNPDVSPAHNLLQDPKTLVESANNDK